MTFCPQCGTERLEGAQFCGKCGLPATATAPSAGGPTVGIPAYGANPVLMAGELVPTIVTLSLVFAFIFPIVGLILAYVSKAQARATGPVSANRNRLALIFSWIFTGFNLITIIAWIALAATFAATYPYYNY
jgi:hypothetical protein